MPRSRAPLFAGIAIVAILAGALLSVFMRSTQAPPITLDHGTLLPSGRTVPAFALVDGDNQPFSAANLQGKWSLMFFGFTNCPDICPTTLALLKQVEAALADMANKPQMIFVSVDPKRDTPAQVAQYTRFFSPSLIGLTGEQAQIDQLTQKMGVPVAIHDLGNGAYTVDHAATLFLVNPQGEIRAVFSPPHTVAALASDLRKIITSVAP